MAHFCWQEKNILPRDFFRRAASDPEELAFMIASNVVRGEELRRKYPDIYK